MPWPSWLDEIESKLAERDKTCLDCGVLIDGKYVYPVFRGDGCDHADD